MIRAGCHLSATKGYLAMAQTAVSIGADTFQFFTRNPRGGRAKPVDEEDIKSYINFADEHGIGMILAHAPYTLNLASDDGSKREFAVQTMKSDLATLEKLPEVMYNFHPGNHMKQGAEKGISLIIEGLKEIIAPNQKTVILLETMAGKGTEIGRNFEELREILAGAEAGDRLGVCLDTCHIADGGYDVVNNLEGVLDEFDRVIGLSHLKALHINDSKNPVGSHKDRHEKLGQGFLGMETFRAIVNQPCLRKLPMYLETPNELDGYAEEIRQLRQMADETEAIEFLQ